MKTELARVLGREDLECERGPDATLGIDVPGDWLDGDTWVRVELPRLLSCARCDGGGCDGCKGQGGVETRPRGGEAERFVVLLPRVDGGAKLRLLRLGGLHTDDGLPRGHLILVVSAADDASPRVERVETPRPAPQAVSRVQSNAQPGPPFPLALWLGAVALLLLLAYLITR